MRMIWLAVSFFCLIIVRVSRVDYYPTVVFVTTNKYAQVALGNWALVMALAFGKLIRKVFLGPLRDIEVEVRRNDHKHPPKHEGTPNSKAFVTNYSYRTRDGLPCRGVLALRLSNEINCGSHSSGFCFWTCII